MSETVRNVVKESKEKMYEEMLKDTIVDLESQGLYVEFGNIGLRTTYALVYSKNHEIEFVGYTFLKNMKYYNETIGRLKALQQAIARRDIASEES